MNRTLFLVFVLPLLAISLACDPAATTANNTRTNTAPAAQGAKSPAAAAPAAPKAEMSATAMALANEYDADPKSMEKYSGKAVEITGKFDRSAGSETAPEVKFETGGATSVTCRLDPSAIQAAAKLEKGQEIKMVGTGDPYSIIGPLFKDCKMAS